MELKSQETMTETALTAALRASVYAPELPEGFRGRLLQRLQAEQARDAQALRAAVEQEALLARELLRRESVQLRWETLWWLVGGAFAAGAATVVAMPWVAEHLGPSAVHWVPVGVASLGLVLSWARAPLVQRFWP